MFDKPVLSGFKRIYNRIIAKPGSATNNNGSVNPIDSRRAEYINL